MKNVVFLIVILFSIGSCKKENGNSASDSVELFEKINSPTGENITDASFINESEGIICGGYGFLAKTNDGGKTFTSFNVGTPQTFLSAFLLDEQNFFTARLGLYRTQNSGASFAEIGNLSQQQSSIFNIHFSG